MSAKLRELLESEPFPRAYPHKFIGQNTDVFRAACARLLEQWPSAKESAQRESAQGTYLSMTWTVWISSAQDVERLMEQTMAFPDLKTML